MRASRVRIFPARQGFGPPVEGDVVVSPMPFSARYDLDRVTGAIMRLDHPLQGLSVVDKILIAPAVQGGVAAGWALLDMRSRGVGIAGLVLGRANPVMVQGAITAGIPVLVGLEDEVFAAIHTGDRVLLDPAARKMLLT